MLRIFGTASESIVDGPGLRYAIFTQGCPHMCEGCHNPKSHDINGGYDIETAELLQQIDKNPLLDGVTLSGGEPILQAKELQPLAAAVKQRGLSLILYSGYTFEEIQSIEHGTELLVYTDILVDGKFDIKKRSLDLTFRGSSNQRIIDVQRSLEEGCTVLCSFDD